MYKLVKGNEYYSTKVIFSGIFSSIVEIYRQNGVFGFFSGLIPRLLGEVISLLLANALTYVINTYVFEERELQTYTAATTSVSICE